MSENVTLKPEPTSQTRPQGLLEELKAMGVYLEPRTVINLYGPPMVGKSVLALHIANIAICLAVSRATVKPDEVAYAKTLLTRGKDQPSFSLHTNPSRTTGACELHTHGLHIALE